MDLEVMVEDPTTHLQQSSTCPCLIMNYLSLSTNQTVPHLYMLFILHPLPRHQPLHQQRLNHHTSQDLLHLQNLPISLQHLLSLPTNHLQQARSQPTSLNLNLPTRLLHLQNLLTKLLHPPNLLTSHHHPPRSQPISQGLDLDHNLLHLRSHNISQNLSHLIISLNLLTNPSLLQSRSIGLPSL